jgi:glutamate-1-semialdehyde 2,1-aminomutase
MRISMSASHADRSSSALDELIRDKETAFVRRHPVSMEMGRAGGGALIGGATSNWQMVHPGTVWISHAEASAIWDVDGNEYADFQCGYGVDLVGHANPAVVEAVTRQVARGAHYGQPVEDAVTVAAELARRFSLPYWRLCGSGTEATMDAVHLMRAVTGRDRIVKIEGGYHGHHDSVMVSVGNDADEIGPPDRPASPIFGSGIPRALADLTLVAPFNDPAALDRILTEHPGGVAGIIMEPIMMNAGIIPPEPGYLESVREITRRHGALLAFDEVKTGLSVGPGGATALLGVTPDIVCLAKALGGGLPCGAIGGTAEVMGLIAEGEYPQVGTFNGNPLSMAAARATLLEILDDDAYRHIEHVRDKIDSGARRIVAETGLEAYVLTYGAKGSITFSSTPVRNYRDFLAVDDRFGHGHWLFQETGNVLLPPWGKSEQWTISVLHTDDDADRFLENLGAFASAVGSG